MEVNETKELLVIALAHQMEFAGLIPEDLLQSEYTSKVTYRLCDLVLSPCILQKNKAGARLYTPTGRINFTKKPVTKCQFLGQRCENTSDIVFNEAVSTAKVVWSR